MKQRIQTTKRLGDVLNAVTDGLPAQGQTRLAALKAAWLDILTADVAQVTRPLRIARNHLDVEVKTHLTSTLKALLDEQLSETLTRFGIEGVTYRQSNVAPKAADKRVIKVSPTAEARTAAIKDPALRTAMARLLSAFDDTQR